MRPKCGKPPAVLEFLTAAPRTVCEKTKAFVPFLLVITRNRSLHALEKLPTRQQQISANVLKSNLLSPRTLRNVSREMFQISLLRCAINQPVRNSSSHRDHHSRARDYLQKNSLRYRHVLPQAKRGNRTVNVVPLPSVLSN